jgi:UDP:flavonoid glycosyltransferase YjiC (YdhE family)
MRLLAACSLGGAGHLTPLLAFLREAASRGDDVMIVAPPALQDTVARTRIRLRVGGEPAESEVAPIRERLATAPREEASVLANRELFGRLAADAMMAPMREAFNDWRPDLVLRDPCEYASAVVALERGVAVAQVAISLAQVERGSIDVAAPVLEGRRSGLVDELIAMPYLSAFPASMDHSTFTNTLRYRNADAGSGKDLPDWWNGSRAPLIYATLGSVLGHMSIAADSYRAVIESLAQVADARVLLTVGRRFDASVLGSLPSRVHVEAWVDQADVLGVADLVLCHGGSGTVFGAMAAGVPVVSGPMFADQYENGRRLERVGAGVTLEGGRSADPPRSGAVALDPRRIASAVATVMGEGAYRDAARRVAAEMREAPAPGEVLSLLQAGLGT